MKKQRVAAYCRVSTTMDAQDGSFETQMKYYRNKLGADCYELVDVYGDYGKSGTEMRNRPEFQRMIKAAEQGKIDVIYCRSISRFARNMAECTEMIRHLKDCGVTLIFEKEGIRTDAPSMDLILSIMATLAEEESHSISQNSKQIRNYKNSIGEPIDHPCYGYRKAGDTWKIDPLEGKRVQQIFKMAAEGYTYDEMLDQVNALEAGCKTRRKWSKAMIRSMLLNPRYTGDILTNKTVVVTTEKGKKQVVNDGLVSQYMIEDHHEALVSDELFHIVGAMVQSGVPMGNRINRAEQLSLIDQARMILQKESA